MIKYRLFFFPPFPFGGTGDDALAGDLDLDFDLDFDLDRGGGDFDFDFDCDLDLLLGLLVGSFRCSFSGGFGFRGPGPLFFVSLMMRGL